LRLKDAALRIDERDTLAIEDEARLQLGRGQVIVHLAQPSHLLESRHAHCRRPCFDPPGGPRVQAAVASA
jgi:hypothetical protein